MKYILVIAATAIALSSAAQDCTKEALLKLPGNWKAGPQGSVQNVSAADLAKEKSVLAAVHKMVSTRYSPKGCEISYSTVFGKQLVAGRNWTADPYHYSMYILRYLCDGG